MVLQSISTFDKALVSLRLGRVAQLLDFRVPGLEYTGSCMKPLMIPFRYALVSWTVIIEAVTGKVELLREGSLIGTMRYDPDFGFGQVPPPVQPMIMVLRDVLMRYDDRIRFVQHA